MAQVNEFVTVIISLDGWSRGLFALYGSALFALIVVFLVFV